MIISTPCARLVLRSQSRTAIAKNAQRYIHQSCRKASSSSSTHGAASGSGIYFSGSATNANVVSLTAAAIAISATTIYYFSNGSSLITPVYAEEKQESFSARQTPSSSLPSSSASSSGSGVIEPEMLFEKPRRKPKSKEENRNMISSQHLQVQRSWENPGVYAWGSNSGRVAAPRSDERVIKTPRRIPFFNGMLLRDIKLDRLFGAAIDENGDLLQWGTGYAKDCVDPVKTLKGKNLKKLAISRDRILGLGSNGAVYSVPVSQEDQENGSKLREASWIPFWTRTADLSYRRTAPFNLGWGEKIQDIACGLEHLLMVTSKGRVFSAAAGSEDFPSKGQMGIPGLMWATRPPGAYDQCHEIVTLRGFDIAKIAAGDYHSLTVDKDGRVFSFGDNSYGQLGHDLSRESSFIDAPALIPIHRLYAGANQVPRVTGVGAGGNNSYFFVEAAKTAMTNSLDGSVVGARRGPPITADVWSCGHGIFGMLGVGRWTHVQSTPVKIASLSGLFEWDDVANRAIPIRLARLSVGSNHAAAVMDNVTYVDATRHSSENDTNWGADVVFFGNNEFYQLGTGKRNNLPSPTYIQPLDSEAEKKIRGKDDQQHRFQITPRKDVNVGGRRVSVEQRVECGRGLTAVYSGV